MLQWPTWPRLPPLITQHTMQHVSVALFEPLLAPLRSASETLYLPTMAFS